MRLIARVAMACSCKAQKGPPLIAKEYIHGLDDDAIARSIRDGFPEKGMPVWREVLSEDDIRSLVKFIDEKRGENTLQHLREMDEAQIRSIRVIATELEKFRIEVLGKTGMPWGLAALPDGRLLLTEQQGVLRVIERGRLAAEPIKGTPSGNPRDRFQRILLDPRIPVSKRMAGSTSRAAIASKWTARPLPQCRWCAGALTNFAAAL